MTGCSEPPVKEHDQAVAAIASARTAGAVTYAAADLKAAEASLTRYDEFVAQRDFKQALSAALDARDRAFEAATAAAKQQTALRVEADTLLTSLEQSITAADTLLKSARARALAKPADALRRTRKATTVAMQEARTLLASGELSRAVRRLTDATAALKRDSVALDDASKKLKK
jgi:hypothetical protein